MTNAFDQFLSSDEPAVQEAAKMLNLATSELHLDKLTPKEYSEIANNLLDFSKISATISDKIRQQKIYDLFTKMLSIAETIKKLA